MALPSLEGANQLGLIEFLKRDPRPSAIIDLPGLGDSKAGDDGRIVYVNSALRAAESLYATVVNAMSDNLPIGKSSFSFRTWALEAAGPDREVHDEQPIQLLDAAEWSRTTINSQWRVISCGQISARRRRSTPAADLSHGAPWPASPSASGAIFKPWNDPMLFSADWTAPTAPLDLTPWLQLVRNHEWHTTPVGAMQGWSVSIRRACNLVMADPRAAVVIWGKQMAVIYNEKYAEILGSRHPACLGRPFNEVFPEIDDTFIGYYDDVIRTGIAITRDDSLFFLKRDDFIEELYISFSLMPIFEGSEPCGVYNKLFESTRTQVAERRMSMLVSLSELAAKCNSPEQLWKRVTKAAQLNQNDIPFVSVYSVLISDSASESSFSSADNPSTLTLSKQFSLQGYTGLPGGHLLTAEVVDLKDSNHLLISQIRNAVEKCEPVIIGREDTPLHNQLFKGIRCPPFEDPCQNIVILPIAPLYGKDSVQGFLIVGVGPRRPYDDDFRQYHMLLSRLLGSSLASSMLVEEELKRGRMEAEKANQAAKSAANHNLTLAEQLNSVSAQRARLERQFTHFADNAPIAVNVFSVDGVLLYANDIWLQYTGMSLEDKTPHAFWSAFYQEDLTNTQEFYRQLLEEKRAVTFEVRLRKPWKPPMSGEEEALNYTWILASAHPELNDDGSVECIIGCFMDISEQKWSQGEQSRRMDEAIEAKRLQEAFIDMTSHEMRNPLSAIIHCADSIEEALEQETGTDATKEVLQSASIILHCAKHQKRVIDDVLNLSKIDSNLLEISPEPAQIVSVVRKTITAFDAELIAANIDLHFDIDSSFDDLCIDWVYVDPTRLAQILINLLANAIKFTREDLSDSDCPADIDKLTNILYTEAEAVRIISVRLRASRTKPLGPDGPFTYVPVKVEDRRLGPETEDFDPENIVYIQLEVSDTGPGITQSEIDILFQKFSQANPRTHVRYGGSGLGLFVARRITELLGGEVGVRSDAGEGSTFAFYIRASRCAPPVEQPRRKNPREHLTILRPPSLHKAASVGGTAHAAMSSSVPGVENTGNNGTTDAAAKEEPKRSVPLGSKFGVLLVEDNIVNRKVAARQLRKSGYLIHEANHGQEALDFIRTTTRWAGMSGMTPQKSDPIDLAMILLDIEMPIMDGLTCIAEIRKLQESGAIKSHIPTLAVTANARHEQFRQCMDSGMDGVVSKPFRIPDLIAEMESLHLRFDERRRGADVRAEK